MSWSPGCLGKAWGILQTRAVQVGHLPLLVFFVFLVFFSEAKCNLREIGATPGQQGRCLAARALTIQTHLLSHGSTDFFSGKKSRNNVKQKLLLCEACRRKMSPVFQFSLHENSFLIFQPAIAKGFAISKRRSLTSGQGFATRQREGRQRGIKCR